jgi:hypothetical protein
MEPDGGRTTSSIRQQSPQSDPGKQLVPAPIDNNPLSDKLLKTLLAIVIVYQVVAIAIIVAWSVVTWNQPGWTVLFVPQFVLEWSLIGAVAGALFRLASYPRLTAQEKATLFLWVLAKPFVGTAFGGVVYFLAVGGVLILQGNPTIAHPELMAAIGFVAGFSDRFAFSAMDRLSSVGGDNKAA